MSTPGTTYWPAACILLITLAAYSPVRDAGFVWDDRDYLVNNNAVRAADGLGRIWTDPTASPQYYPLVFTSFWIEHQLWGLNPAGYHWTNVALHILNALLVWRLLAALGIPGAWAAAALFAVHPIHAESVAWISERKNVLSGLFYLGAMIVYLKFSGVSTGQPRTTRWYVASLLLFACALFSKTVSCSLPAVLLVLVWWKRGRLTSDDARAIAPFFLIGALAALLTVHLEKTHVGASGPDWDISFAQRGIIAGKALWFYLMKLVVPSDLTFIYPRWEIDPGQIGLYLFPLSAAAFLTGSLWIGRRGVFAAAMVYIMILFPALGFFDIYPMRYTFVADHYAYLASIVPLAAVGAAGTRLFTRRTFSSGACVVLTLALTALTFRQAEVYRSEWTLWTDTIRKNPKAWIAWNNLGMIKIEQNNSAAAAPYFVRAAGLHPQDPSLLTNAGLCLTQVGRTAEAEHMLRDALGIQPAYLPARAGLARILLRSGRADEAVTELRIGALFDSRNTEIAELLMEAQRAAGKLP